VVFGRDENVRARAAAPPHGDITPEPDDQDDGGYETAGNLICQPDVKLADVRPSMRDDPGPTAA